MKEHYLHSVRILMDCPSKEKERLLSRLSNAITAYLEDMPEADEKDIVINFGTPEDCAAKLSAECAPKAVAAERRKKVKHHRIIVAILSVLLAIVVAISAFLWSNGGLVIIHTQPGRSDFWDNLPSDHIIYDYDD